VALLLSLTACETAGFRANVCPPIVEYSKAQMQQAGDELEAIAGLGFVMVPQMIEDYGRERAMLRAC
jgi:hypothetical protein